MSRIITVTENNGVKRTIGEVINGVLILPRKKSVHFFRKLNAWGLDEKVARNIEGVDSIEVHEEETKQVYRLSLSDFIRLSTRHEFRHHRTQLFVAATEWQRV